MNWHDLINLFLYNPKEPLLFHTGFFLFIFSIFLLLYALVFDRDKLKNAFLIAFSLYFYYKASGMFVLMLIFTVSADYVFSLLIFKQEKELYRKLILTAGIIFSLSFLFYFKYRNFFIENVDMLIGKNFTPSVLILPIGISFYTFQSISYLVDVYNRKIERTSYFNYVLYMTFFPHLVAGPIVRARDFIPQIKPRPGITTAEINEAFYLITKGLIKKAIIADFVGQYCDIIFSAPNGFSGTEHILSTLCYTLQIFCDFSGYTDMAIGVALLVGFRLCLNFNSPYKALNITDFWRRWHISLSTWLRDYVYIPMGGNRKGPNTQLLFLLITMLIGGFWHGANWKFIFWGGAHGCLLIVHKLFMKWSPKEGLGKWFTYFGWLLTFCCIALLWVPFRAASIQETWLVYTKMFTDSNLPVIKALMQVNSLLFVLLFCGYFFTVMPTAWKDRLKMKYYSLDFVLKMLMLVVIIQGIIQLRTLSVQPFIYFQF